MVGGFKHVLFLHILGIIIPTDELIFFRGVGQPPTIYIYIYNNGFYSCRSHCFGSNFPETNPERPRKVRWW